MDGTDSVVGGIRSILFCLDGYIRESSKTTRAPVASAPVLLERLYTYTHKRYPFLTRESGVL